MSATLAGVLAVGVVILSPVARAQEVAGSIGGVDQGASQGTNQGTTNGGPTLESLGVFPDESGEVDTSVLGATDPRQGANQGVELGSPTPEPTVSAVETSPTTTLTAGNTTTGPSSTNTSDVSLTGSTATTIENVSDTTTTVAGSATTGENTASENTGSASVTTGDASVGVQQVTADNLVTTGSSGEIEHNLSAGSQSGDLVLEFTPEGEGESLTDSFRSVNTVTGSLSDNSAAIDVSRETLVEVQNDGTITNDLDVAAITGENEANQNTGNANVATGNANVAATLLNFLNATVVDGALWLSVSDIFGDLAGNVVISEDVVSYLTRRQRELEIAVANESTGTESTNTVGVTVEKTSTTDVVNTADVTNDIAIDAITGQNAATQNTGNSTITTGNVQATANTVTLANTTVVDGSLGLIIVNALNRWMGFLLGADGTWTPIDHEFTTIVAGNAETGADSTNTSTVDVSETDETTIENAAKVSNTLGLSAITGKNTANQNTGNANVATGDAHVQATVVNMVNTNVIRGSLFVAVVNVFGNWLGELLFGGQPVTALAAGGGGSAHIDAANDTTGEDSLNTIAVGLSNTEEVTVENTAKIENTLTVEADTGHNATDRNTGLGSIQTGDALAALHARNIANVTLAGVGSSWANITADLLNATTGADSTNTIDVTVDDTRDVVVLNEAAVDTAIGAVANTGVNTASRNTLGGRILTGIAAVIAHVENLLNQTWFVGYEDGGAPRRAATLGNGTTGLGSTNTTSFLPAVATTVTLDNDAEVATTADLAATSGGNEANRNTGTPPPFTASVAAGVPPPTGTGGGTVASAGSRPPVGVGSVGGAPDKNEGEDGKETSTSSVAPAGGGGESIGAVLAGRVRTARTGPRASREAKPLGASSLPRTSAIGPVSRWSFVGRVLPAGTGTSAGGSAPVAALVPPVAGLVREAATAARGPGRQTWPWVAGGVSLTLLTWATGAGSRLTRRSREAKAVLGRIVRHARTPV